VNVGDRGRFAVPFGSGGLLLALHHAFRHHAFQEEGDGAVALGGFAYFGARGEDTQFGVGGDLFDDFGGFGFGVAVGCGFGDKVRDGWGTRGWWPGDGRTGNGEGWIFRRLKPCTPKKNVKTGSPWRTGVGGQRVRRLVGRSETN
jgi:hypothetical protein